MPTSNALGVRAAGSKTKMYDLPTARIHPEDAFEVFESAPTANDSDVQHKVVVGLCYENNASYRHEKHARAQQFHIFNNHQQFHILTKLICWV